MLFIDEYTVINLTYQHLETLYSLQLLFLPFICQQSKIKSVFLMYCWHSVKKKDNLSLLGDLKTLNLIAMKASAVGSKTQYHR